MIVLVAGGTGFVGSSVVKILQENGHETIVYHRKFRAVPTHVDAIVNCVGIIKERHQTFREAHVDITKWLVGLGKKLNVKKFVQISALGADVHGVSYQRTKAQAEKIVRESMLPYVILRPSMIFGKGDKSINTFRRIAQTGFFPVLSHAKVQPVHVNIVANVVLASLTGKLHSTTVEVAGPEVLTYEEIADRIHPGVITFTVPDVFVDALTLFSWIPSVPTKDMVRMLRQDNVATTNVVSTLKLKNQKLS